MNILIDGRLLSPDQSGITRYTEHLVAVYIEKVGRTSVRLLYNRYCPERYQDIGISCALTPYHPLDFLRLPGFLSTLKVDVIHFPQYSGLCRKLTDIRIVTTVHDLMYRKVEGFFNRNRLLNTLAVAYFDWLVGKSLRHADQMISVSQTTQQDIKEAFGLESTVIGEGVNQLGEHGIDSNRILARYELRGGDYFLYAGNLRPQKNIPFLIRCFLESKVSDTLILCGKSREKDLAQIQPLLKESGSVRIIGFVPDEELQVLYANCKAFVFPSLYEGFGLPILEALKAGARVLSSNRGALSAFREDGIYFFDPADPEELIHLIRSASALKPPSPHSDITARYDWRIFMEKTWTLVSDLTKDS